MLVLKIAAFLILAVVVLAMTYVRYKYIVTNPFTFPRKEDCDYKQDEAVQTQTCDLAVNKTQCAYEKRYCYRNIWNLAKKFKEEHPEELQNMYVVFISSLTQLMHTWMQIRGKGESGKVCYKYHVVLLYTKNERSWILDFDSRLKFPEELKSYCRQTFRTESIFLEGFQPLFRVIRADAYLKTFDPARDEVILCRVENSLLWDYVKIVPGEPASERYGEVLHRYQFYSRFAQKSQQTA